jgi:hypothetical protein
MMQNENPEAQIDTAFSKEWNTWRIIKWVLIAFPILIFYIYNSLHTAKALKKRNELNKVLKELHSERISLESEISQASKQTKIAEQMEHKGLKELTAPPKKIIRDND